MDSSIAVVNRVWTYNPTAPYYYPTVVDVMPHLLPDLHPWWAFFPIMSPSLCLWGHCFGFPLYNPILFANPTADVVHAPGAGSGFAPSYDWIDGGFNLVIPVNMQPFGPWGTGTNWGRASIPPRRTSPRRRVSSPP